MEKAVYTDTMLPFVTKASRYLGNEINAVKKDLSKVEIKCALVFPDAYEVGMSHLGLHILYHVLNSQEHIACERAFAPWVDMQALMKQHSLTLATLESHIPLRDCDIIGFSLEYELSYATVLTMLSLAHIPLPARDRDPSWPLVIAGGPSMFNPEPVADFFDAMVIGEGEEVILELCEAVRTWKKQRASKEELLHTLAEIRGVYVPSFFNVHYNRDGTLQGIIPLKKGYETIHKRFITDFSGVAFCTSPVVPYMQIVHDRAGIEIARGCSRGCRFCMAGMIYRPVREKNIATIRCIAEKMLGQTGYEELSLASLSSGDFSDISGLLQLLMQDHRHNKIAIALPSLRVETLTRDVIEQIKQVRKTGFTLAPEAGTQRLRNVINKGITEEEIVHTVTRIFTAGWNLVKLYFMIGLPTETPDDLDGIVALSKKIAAIDKRKQINISISTFVPKPHTPFQWVVQEQAASIRAKQHYLRKNLQGRNIRVKWHNHDLSILEGIFSRGDRRLGSVLLQAHKMGAGFEAWTEHFNPDLWNNAFAACRLNKNFYLRQRHLSEGLPWSHISCGIQNDFLQKEFARALEGTPTPDCRRASCSNCGVCSPDERVYKLNEQNTPNAGAAHAQAARTPGSASVRYRLYFAKLGPARFLSQLELSSCFARAMRRAQLPLKYSNGFHPLPKISFYDALPVGMESREQICDVELLNTLEGADIPGILNPHLPEGLIVCTAEQNVLKIKQLADKIVNYVIYFPKSIVCDYPDPTTIKGFINQFDARKEYIFEYVKKRKTSRVDLKQFVSHVALRKNNVLEIALNKTGKQTPAVAETIQHILNLSDKETKALRIIKLNT